MVDEDDDATSAELPMSCSMYSTTSRHSGGPGRTTFVHVSITRVRSSIVHRVSSNYANFPFTAACVCSAPRGSHRRCDVRSRCSPLWPSWSGGCFEDPAMPVDDDGETTAGDGDGDGDGEPADGDGDGDGGAAVCGDGQLQGDEACDDGNLDDGDGCDLDCSYTLLLDLSCGDGHSCVIVEGGRVRCWGTNASGQLGHGDLDPIGDDEVPATAADVALPGPAVQVVANGLTTCAKLEDGASQ
jgi:cysteine-rich repeat protein